MDGSVCFRAFTALFNALKALCGGSFIVALFTAHHMDDAAGGEHSFGKTDEAFVSGSIIARLIHMILNGFKKPLQLPDTFPVWLSGLMQGSWLVDGFTASLDIPIPVSNADKGSGENLKGLILWGMYAMPVVGVAVIVFATPFLPTMLLAFLMIPILFFIFLSRHFVIDRLAVCLFLFIIINSLAGILSVAPSSSLLIAVLTSVFVLSVAAIMAIAQSRRSVDLLIIIFSVSAAFTGLVGAWQMVARYTTNLWLDFELHTDIPLRVMSTFDNPNVYGTYLLLAIPVAAACIVFLRGWFLKICAAGVCGLLLVNLLMTYSRGAYVALALGIAVFVLIMEKRLIVLSLPAVLALPFVLPSSVLNRLLSIVNFADTSTLFRFAIYQGSIRIIGDFWMSGVGQGIEAFHIVYPYYALAAAGTLHSHNLFLQILIELGLIGFLVFIAILACFFRGLATLIRHTQDTRVKVMAASMVASMIGFLAQGMFDHNFFNYRLMLVFYLFIGISMAFVRVYREHQNELGASSQTPPALL